MTVFGINFYANDELIDTMIFDSVETRKKVIDEIENKLNEDGYYVDSMCFELFDRHVYTNNENMSDTLNEALEDWKNVYDSYE